MRINKILVSALVMALSFYSCDYLDVPVMELGGAVGIMEKFVG